MVCGRFVGGFRRCGDVGDFSAVESEVPGRVGMGLGPIIVTEEDSGGEDEEDEEDRAHQFGFSGAGFLWVTWLIV